ncbi:MAG TPA: porin [Burkholderiales bacterium]|nr:porin [Burkholderiales bacterium]
MNKKLMAAAVAGALAMPGLALAQSSVTIGGFFKVGIEDIKIDSMNASRTTAAGTTNSSEIRMADNSSRIIFGVSEDLGGGLSAIAQLDNRFSPDNGNINATGNTWVGLKSNSWGALTMGRHDLHYGQNASDMGAGASALKATSISLMDYVNVAASVGGVVAATSAPIANTTRTPNSLKWQSPNWSGFDIIAAYSTSPVAVDSDLASNVRKGYGWNINPHFTAENWGLGYSYWSAKPDGSLADQLGQNAFGYFKWSGFKIGVSYNQSKLKSAAGVDQAKRDAWSIPLSWNTGPHTIYAHYTKANKDKVQDGLGIGDTGAAMAAVAYTYSLSKRTQVGVTYAQIRNEANAAYHFFTDTGTGGDLSSNGAQIAAGEDPKLLALILYHAF